MSSHRCLHTQASQASENRDFVLWLNSMHTWFFPRLQIDSVKRLAVILYALGHGHLTPQDALEQYEVNHGQTYAFELEAGGRAPSGADRRFERAIQTCPCLLCLPCFR